MITRLFPPLFVSLLYTFHHVLLTPALRQHKDHPRGGIHPPLKNPKDLSIPQNILHLSMPSKIKIRLPYNLCGYPF